MVKEQFRETDVARKMYVYYLICFKSKFYVIIFITFNVKCIFKNIV